MELKVVKSLLELPEARIDLAEAKVTIDRLIEPGIDASATLSQLDSLARSLKSMLPMGASSRLTLDALRYHLYQPSPWNGQRPFRYDLDDPFGANIRNKLLATYLATRKGNCISMPLLFIVLGQKLGLDVTAAAAPNHVFVKYRGDDGQVHNLETTSGAGFTREAWMRQQFRMTDASVASGAYMRWLTRKETIVVMLDTLLQSYDERGLQAQRIGMCQLALQHNPKDIPAILHQHQAYLTFWKNEFGRKYRSSAEIPLIEQPRFIELESRLMSLYDRAYYLGWRPPEPGQDAAYLRSVRRAKGNQ